jgi:hypothetical protein
MVARGKVLKLLDAERYVKVMQLYIILFLENGMLACLWSVKERL